MEHQNIASKIGVLARTECFSCIYIYIYKGRKMCTVCIYATTCFVLSFRRLEAALIDTEISLWLSGYYLRNVYLLCNERVRAIKMSERANYVPLIVVSTRFSIHPEVWEFGRSGW